MVKLILALILSFPVFLIVKLVWAIIKSRGRIRREYLEQKQKDKKDAESTGHSDDDHGTE